MLQQAFEQVKAFRGEADTDLGSMSLQEALDKSELSLAALSL